MRCLGTADRYIVIIQKNRKRGKCRNEKQSVIFAEKREDMNNSNSSNKVQVPEAKNAMNRFKMEVASELNVPLKEGYNGDLTSAQNGSVGGEMVRQMIKKQEESMSNNSAQ